MMILAISTKANAFIPERRNDTSSIKPGYLIAPLFTDVPGIGTAVGAGFIDANMLNSRSDLEIAVVVGNLSAAIVNISNIHLGDHILFNFGVYGSKLGYQVFDRGGYSDQSSFNSPLHYEYGGSGDLTFRFWEDRLQFFGHFGPSKLQFSQVSDSASDSFANADNAFHDTVSTSLGVRLDFTDNVLDPRRGLRLEASRIQELFFDPTRSQWYTANFSGTYFVPVASSTLVFNYFRSSAYLIQANGYSQSQLQSAMSLNCQSITNVTLQSRCTAVETQRVQERFAENSYGTAAPLGGSDRMRGFLQNRFHGSQAQFFGSEFRFNVLHDGAPFDLGFMKGVRSNVQLAAFYEVGQVSDTPLAVEQAPLRSDFGFGLRFLFSGVAIRADVGIANEGTQFTLFFGYPWQGSFL